MSPRTYRLGRRAEGVEDTRRRILEAARALLTETGFHRASLEEVARRAGVTRPTVYHQFGSKLGLLDALVLDTERRAGMHGLETAARAEPTLSGSLRFGLRELCAAWAREPLAFRRLIGLAAVDPEAREVVARHDRRWRRGVDRFARELDAAGLLRPGWSPPRAAAVLHLLLSFETFDRLYAGGDMAPGEVADTLIALAGAVVEL